MDIMSRECIIKINELSENVSAIVAQNQCLVYGDFIDAIDVILIQAIRYGYDTARKEFSK